MSSRRGIEIDFSNRQDVLPVPIDRWRRLLDLVLASANLSRAELSIAIVDDTEMHQLNRQYLDHDYPTDVLSFVLERTDDWLAGEIIVSSETALQQAAEYDWTPEDELTLYVLHGSLHLIGYDDKDPVDRAAMRARENHFLELLGMANARRNA